jgi:hypothetical protein
VIVVSRNFISARRFFESRVAVLFNSRSFSYRWFAVLEAFGRVALRHGFWNGMM